MELKICRICEIKTTYKNIFDSRNKDIWQKLQECANIKLEEDDKLPKYICTQCCDLLRIAHDFKEQCEKTDQRLRSSLSSPTPEIIVIKEEALPGLEYDDMEEPVEFLYANKSEINSEESDLSQNFNLESDRSEFKPPAEAYPSSSTENNIKVSEIREKKFPKRRQRKRRRKSSKTKIFKCPKCCEDFTILSDFKIHLGTHIDQSLFRCSLCEKDYIVYKNLKRHIEEFHKENDCSLCFTCSFAYPTKESLDEHLLFSEEKCIICDKKFESRCELLVHKWEHEVIIQRRPRKQRVTCSKQIYRCQYCGKVSKNSHLHSNHIRIHTGERPYSCSLCEKTFKTHPGLYAHEKLHTDKRPYKCEQCGHSFRQYSHLKTHQVVHLQNKPLLCGYCGKAFRLKGNLNVHERQHTGEKPYECRICMEKFSDLNGRKRHEKMHALCQTTELQIEPLLEWEICE